MNTPSAILLLLAAITGIAMLARRLLIPYPIAFVVGGAALAFMPHAPLITLNPDLIFILILPPLLYAGGWTTDVDAFRKSLRSILLLAIGLVIATTVCVAYVAHAIVPELPLAAAFVLGAIISPPDAVAASGVFERFSVPRRIITVLEGEGLVNDATALVVYGFAVAAVSTGAFQFSQAALAFLGVSLGGIAVGFVSGFLLYRLSLFIQKTNLSDSLIDNLIALLAPYGVYLLGGAFHVSSVLATVVAGIFMSQRSSELFTPESRLTTSAVWELMIFMLNAAVFLLIGLELPVIVSAEGDLHQLLIWGAIISLVVIVVRMLWVFPGAYLPRLIPAIRRNEPPPAKRAVLVVAWSGMRGVVSLAAALALPNFTAAGTPFPGRSTILFITFCVIFSTLVLQGLSLIPLLTWLKLESEDLVTREREVRIAALEAAIATIRMLEADFDSVEEWQVAGRLVSEYTYRIEHLRARLDGLVESAESALDHRLQRIALEAEHDAVLAMRDAGEIPDELFRKIRYDLDLASSRLA